MTKATAMAMAFASPFVLASVAQAEAFDATHCHSGTVTVVFASDNATVVTFDSKGIYRSNGESKLLDGFSIHCSGTDVILNKKSVLRGGCRVLDPKGEDNSIFLTFAGTGGPKGVGTATAVGGTGTWKGISGGGDWEVHTPSKPVVPGTFQSCLRYHGTFTVPK